MLDTVSDGRAFLGLARGAWLEDLRVDQPDAATAVREAWDVVRLLLAGEDGGYDGERFSLPQGARLRYQVRRRSVPLLVGTSSPKLAAFAGEHAQEVKVGGSANPDVVPVMRERIGNDAVRIVLGAVTVVDADGERARSHARREVAMYLAVVAELDPTVSLDPELLSRVRELVAAGDDQAAGALISDDVLDRFAFAGTPEAIAAHAEAAFDAGAGRIDFGTPHGVPEAHGVELLCTQVLPRLG
jgi:5,10-methylenetetrahydromethanopterin reductase